MKRVHQSSVAGPPVASVVVTAISTAFISQLVISSVVVAQPFQRAQTPIVAQYPGGHTGLRNGAVPPEDGLLMFVFNRFHQTNKIIDASGQQIPGASGASYTINLGAEYITPYKIFGMKYGALASFPFVNGAYNRPSSSVPGDSNAGESTMGLNSVIVLPLILYDTSRYLDYSFGLGTWIPAGSFTPGAAANRGSGYWNIFYVANSCYYPTGERKGFAFCAGARIEQNFKQRDTGIRPGDALTIDFGIDHPIAFPLSTHKYIFDVGVAGFVQTQITRETGANAALNTSPYRIFGIGPEVDWLLLAYETKLILRPQWEFGAYNTSSGWTFWLGLAKEFGPLL